MVTSTEIKLTKGSLQVTLFTTMIEQIINKTLIVHALPISTDDFTDKGGTGAVDPLIIDLARNETRFAIDGNITKDSASDPMGSGDTDIDGVGTYDADKKRATLIKMVNGGGSQTMNWNGINYTINIDKLTITQNQSSSINSTLEVEEFTVKITAVLGSPFLA